ncbi:unnamed protein product [Notodromas monacha]|uniref:PRA1 family protein n=1 Tax=Notodromas monacha TaxID=399045 RepID=A0A7R9BLU2_9CRUS|nr:unnamed protein product [Notodromas monacha]CAG0916542.1 unnamed protein product [Notodromas monacha]
MGYSPDEPMRLAPMRSFNDFLAEASRFSLPNFKDIRRANARIIANLLYYQTNYFLSFLLIFTLSFFSKPREVSLGMITFAVILSLSWYFSTNANFQKFRRDHPIVTILMVSAIVFFVARLAGCIFAFGFAFLLPVLLIFLHAMTRMRNTKNKLTNKLEELGLSQPTPMGAILEYFGEDRRFAGFLNLD